jgi:hypothetical protein
MAPRSARAAGILFAPPIRAVRACDTGAAWARFGTEFRGNKGAWRPEDMGLQEGSRFQGFHGSGGVARGALFSSQALAFGGGGA